MFLQDLFRLFRIVYIVFLRSGIRVPERLCFIHVASPHRKAIGPIGCRHDFLIIKCITDRLTEPLIRAEPFFMIDDRCNGPLLCGVNRDIVQTGNPVHIIRRKIKYCFYQLCLIFLSYIYIYFTFLIQLFLLLSLCYHDSRQGLAQARTLARCSRKLKIRT